MRRREPEAILEHRGEPAVGGVAAALGDLPDGKRGRLQQPERGFESGVANDVAGAASRGAEAPAQGRGAGAAGA